MLDKLRILGIDYDVKYESLLANGVGGAGQCDTTLCVIHVCSNENSPEHAKCVLLHEIIEALNYRLELKLDHNVITSLESGLFQILKDNPKLLTLFLETAD